MPELGEFFHDLRALRAGAGLSLAELAERAHFPQEALAAAEAGPGVPPNPVLVAYVQACDGPVGEWEDRWRDACAAAAAAEPPAAAPGPVGAPPPAPRRRRSARRGAVAAVAAAVALAAAGTAVALTRPPAHPAASARPRTSTEASRPGVSGPSAAPSRSSRPRPGVQPASAAPSASPPTSPSPSASAPPVTSRIAGPGCPASQGAGVTLTAARPGPPWAAAQGGWTGNGCDGTSVWTMNPAGKPVPSALTWSFGALPGASGCTLSVYVPTQNAFGAAGYTVTTGAGAVLGTVTVDQAANAGFWVVLGTFAAAGSGYQVQLMPETAQLTAAGPAAKAPGKPDDKPEPPGRGSAIAASAAAAACSG
jgi:hypothetical protein